MLRSRTLLAFFSISSLQTYEELEKAFALPETDPNVVLSGDLKRGVIAEISPLLDYMRKVCSAVEVCDIRRHVRCSSYIMIDI